MNIFKSKLAFTSGDVSPESVIIELTGAQNKLNAGNISIRY